MTIILNGDTGITTPTDAVTGSTSPTNGIYLPTTNALGFSTNSTERMRIDSSGNLLINRTSADPNNFKIQVLANSGYQSGINLTYTAVGSATIWENSSGALAFGNDASNGTTERMRIDSSGNVGIGTASPSYKLDVNGILYTEPTYNVSNPTSGTWYTVLASVPNNSIWQIVVKSLKASNEQFTIYHAFCVIGGVVGVTQVSNYTVGSGCGNTCRVKDNYPSLDDLQVQINTTSVLAIYVTVTRLS